MMVAVKECYQSSELTSLWALNDTELTQRLLFDHQEHGINKLNIFRQIVKLQLLADGDLHPRIKTDIIEHDQRMSPA